MTGACFKAMTVVATILAATAGAAAQEKYNITVALSSGSIPAAAPTITQKLGLFAKHGIEARMTPMDNAMLAATAVMSGSVNFFASGMSEVVVAQSRGQPVIAVNRLYGNFAAVVILAKPVADKLKVSPDAPIAERLKALDGLVIASAGAIASANIGLKQAIESTGAKARLTYMTPGAMSAALDSGAIQGFVASAPYYAPPIRKGTGVLWISGPKGEFPPEFTPGNQAGLHTTRAYADANPEIMKRVIAASDDFLAVARERPQEIKAAIGALYPDLDAAMLDIIFETEILGFQRAKPLTEQDVVREIAFAKGSGIAGVSDSLNPASLLYRPK